jgi:hypothetical protein
MLTARMRSGGWAPCVQVGDTCTDVDRAPASQSGGE